MQRFVTILDKLSTKSKYGLKIINKNELKILKRSLATDSAKNETTIKTYTNKNLSYETTSNIKFNLLPDSIGDLIEKRSKEFPNDISYTFPHNGGLSLTFLELSQRINTMATSLLKIGFKKGTCSL